MAKVIDQTLPTENIEDALDPPIEFLDQYKKTLALPSPHPGLPAGEEILTATKKESRTDTTDAYATYLSPPTNSQRELFKSCLECWREQVDTEEDIDPCFSAQSRHYVKPWVYVPGAPYPFFREFMSQCLSYKNSHPGEIYPPCENLLPDPPSFEFCPNDIKDFTVPNGVNPILLEANCGTVTGPLQWTAPASFDECPDTATLTFQDDDGRKACAIGLPGNEEDCCCTDPPPLAISYTSLWMQITQQQELTVDPENPGCPPYLWAVTSGGGSLDTTEGDTVTYTAPATNTGCADNPTISLHDACDQETEIQLAINDCHDWPNQPAFGLWDHRTTYGICQDGGYGIGTYCEIYLCSDIYTTEGDWWSQSYCYPAGGCVGGNPAPKLWYQYACTPDEPCGIDPCDVMTGYCWNGGNVWFEHPCGEAWDVRTQAMKDNGCCPINPYTGLPI